MSGGLSRSLVDAAAEAIAELNPMSTDPPIAGEPAAYVDDARSAVAAVLETLAASVESRVAVVGGPALRRLAAEVMSADTPSALLVRAADLIRDTAARAAKGPWFVNSEDEPDERVWSENGHPGGYTVAAGGDFDDFRWIALMSPAVAADLSQLLVALESRDYDAARVIAHCLARAVLGEKEEQ